VNVMTIGRWDLGRKRLEAMHALMDRHFSGVDPFRFVRDLRDKHRIVVVEDDEGQVRGFTTLRFWDATVDGRRIQVVCSGDTIVDTSARWNTALAQGWLEAVMRGRSSRPGLPLYWLLICSGYRTYRYLPVFFREFWPRHERLTPPTVDRLMRGLAADLWGQCYEPADGIVRFANPQVLRAGTAWPARGRRRDPHVEFFLRRNPGHFRGDELVCLAPVDESNFSCAGKRILRRIERQAHLDKVVG